MFTFDDLSSPDYECPTNIYVINANKTFYVCDTYLGPDIMKMVKKYLKETFGEKPYVVFNSHADWDHHWGNCAFPNSKIIAHELCKELINKEAEKQLELNKKYQKGKIIITPPNLLFKHNLNLDEDGIKLFHSPGHSVDSSSCYDVIDKVLFAGDTLEKPIPYFPRTLDLLKKYPETIKKYTELEIDTIIPGHGPISDISLLNENKEYIDGFPELTQPIDVSKFGKSFYMVHISNLNSAANLLVEADKKDEAKEYWEKALKIAEQTKAIREESIQRIKEKINNL